MSHAGFAALDDVVGRDARAGGTGRGAARRLARAARDLQPYLLVFVVAALTALGLAGFRAVTSSSDERRFGNATEVVQDAIRVRVEAYVSTLLATRSFLLTSGGATDAARFRAYVAGLAISQRYPGIQGIGFSRRLAAAEVGGVEEQLSREHQRAFRVWPVDARPEFHTIAYLEPLDRRNLAALGFDMFSEPVRNEAMSRARDAGVPAASGRVTLVQEIDPQKQAGFLIYVPVYHGADPGEPEARRAALLGFVYAPFRMDDLMRGIFGSQREPRVEFDVYDGTQIDPAARLFAGIRNSQPADWQARVPLEVAGRAWTLVVRSTPAFDAASGARFMRPLVATGLIGVLVVFLLTHGQARARNHERHAREEAERAVRVREEFLSVAGHELKTPLAALQLQVEGLRRQVEKNAFAAAPDRLVERIARAESLVRRLEVLISNLLDVSRISSGRLAVELEVVDLSALLTEVLERFDEPLRRAGCTLQVDVREPIVGRWDRARLDQVLTNLIGNAVKYGAGKPVEIVVERAPGMARIAVRDHGIGIHRDDVGRIFGRFERAVSVRHYGGLGLGLWISQQIVMALGGRIELESEPGAGSTFTVNLPLDTAR